jgi:hypothetical protein
MGTAAMLTIGALVACTATKHGNDSGAPTGPAPTAWPSVLTQIRPDATVTVATALTAFAVAIGPVPGGPQPTGTRSAIPSGTLAVSWVLAHWAELSPAQRSAVLAALGQPTSTDKPASYQLRRAPQIAPAPVQSPDIACLKADSAGAEKYRAWVPGIEAAITAKLGRPLTIDARTFLSVNTKDLEQPSLLYTWACADASTGNKVSGCTIHINPRTTGGRYTDDMVRSYLIHELTHCYLLDKFGFAYESMPPWYLEGAPTWTMSVLGTANDTLSSHWTSYLDTPAKSLSRRAYDAVGFFAHLAETGTDPWTVIDPIGTALAAAPTTAAGWKAAGVTAEFRDSWGSGFVQGRYPGQAWTATGPNLPKYTPALPNGQLGNGASVTIQSVPFAAAVQRLDVDATVVLVNPGAASAGRISLGDGSDAALGGTGPFCTMAQCACPAGSPGAGTNFTHLASGQEYVGLSGGDQPGTATLLGQSLRDFCKRPPTSCLVGRWTGVNFDVHLDTLTETGGAGVTLHIEPTGRLTVGFDGMRPVVFHSSAVDGTFVYAGTVAGTITLPPGSATSGNWAYASPADVSSLTATIHISNPITVDYGPIDVASLAGIGGGAGGAVSAQPLATGGWRCSGNTLVTSPPAGSPISGSWTLTRTGPG